MKLQDVTLFAIDTAQPKLTVSALLQCMSQVNFGDTFLITNKPIPKAPFRVEVIPALNTRDDVIDFVLHNLAMYVETKFLLNVSWDGFIIDPRQWDDKFLNYDYIGAKWPWYKDGHNIGNSGFSLRSKDLMMKVEAMHAPSGVADDAYIGRTARKTLEAGGMKFAPEEIADKFSYERSLPEMPTFGFHGLFNMWRYLSDDAISIVANKVGEYKVIQTDYIELMMSLYTQRRYYAFEAFYKRFKSSFTNDAQSLRAYLVKAYPQALTIIQKMCECGEYLDAHK